MSEAQEKEITETGGKIAFVDYLILDDPPYLQAQECTSCGARYFDRRNACASCFEDQFRSVAIDQEGIVTSFSIVQMGLFHTFPQWLIAQEPASNAQS